VFLQRCKFWKELSETEVKEDVGISVYLILISKSGCPGGIVSMYLSRLYFADVLVSASWCEF
jgi:hypothetical protein